MISSSFIFTEKTLDDEFFRLDDLIRQAAEDTDGFLGKEHWEDADATMRNTIYYWRDETALRAFSNHPTHQEAKRQYDKWYGGFHVVISKVLKSYGDGAFPHFTPNRRARPT